MEEINTIQKQTKLIKAVFNLSELERITTDKGKINKVFYKLKQEFPEYFERLLFDTNGHIPFSEELDNIFDAFKLSGQVYWEGLSYYILTKDKRYIEELKKNIPKDLPKIKEISDKFSEYIQ